MNLTIVKTVFCPNDTYFNTTINTLFDLNRVLLPNCDFKLVIVGYIKKKEYEKKIREIHFMCPVAFKFFTVNYGKVYLLNWLMEYNDTQQDGYFLFLDHDILIYGFLNRRLITDSISVLDSTIDGKSIGLLAFNQHNDNRHMNFLIQSHHKKTVNSYDVHYTCSPGCVGIGAFLMSWKVFSKLQKIELKNVYGTDDYMLSEQIKDHGMLLGIINSIYVNHPYDDNKEYMAWKKNIVNCDNYWLSIENANNFWNTSSTFYENKPISSTT